MLFWKWGFLLQHLSLGTWCALYEAKINKRFQGIPLPHDQLKNPSWQTQVLSRFNEHAFMPILKIQYTWNYFRIFPPKKGSLWNRDNWPQLFGFSQMWAFKWYLKRLQKGLVSFLVGGLEIVSSVWCQEAKPVLFKTTYDSLELVSELFKSTLVALVVKNLPTNAGDVWGMSLIPGRILWRRAQQITPVFLLEESHGQRSLGGYSL